MRIRVNISSSNKDRFWWFINDANITVDELTREIVLWYRGTAQSATASIMDYKLRPQDRVGDVILEDDIVSIKEHRASGTGSAKTKKRNLRRKSLLKKSVADEMTDKGIVIINKMINCDEYDDDGPLNANANDDENDNSKRQWNTPRKVDDFSFLSPNTLVFIIYMGAFPPSYEPGIHRCFALVVESDEKSLTVQMHVSYLSKKRGRFETGEDSTGLRRFISDEIMLIMEYGQMAETKQQASFDASFLPEEPQEAACYN